ncbi:MAG: arginine deiminase family protein, partial [Actinomycetota bacterium]|nr:arginine deiminase family protein [Actinomycetota bacterium]
MNFSVNSEVGTLRQAIVHRPGLELDRLTPLNVDDLLFDDVMWASRAKEEHDLFSGQLRSHGVVVHEFSQLLREALDMPGAREFLIERLTIATRFGPALDKPLDLLVSSTPAAELADILIGGLLKREILPLLHTSSLLIDHLEDNDFLLTPLPNHLFQRDNSAWVYDGLSINPMSKQPRKRETINSQVAYNFHPMFSGSVPAFLCGNDALAHVPATIE